MYKFNHEIALGMNQLMQETESKHSIAVPRSQTDQ